MNKGKQGLSLEDDKLPDQVEPKSVIVPPTQPLPKRESEIRANISTNPQSKKSDSNPTL